MKMCESDYIPENISSGTAYLAYFVSHETRSAHRLYFVWLPICLNTLNTDFFIFFSFKKGKEHDDSSSTVLTQAGRGHRGGCIRHQQRDATHALSRWSSHLLGQQPTLARWGPALLSHWDGYHLGQSRAADIGPQPQQGD